MAVDEAQPQCVMERPMQLFSAVGQRVGARFVEEPTVDIDSQWLQVAVSRLSEAWITSACPRHLLSEPWGIIRYAGRRISQ